MPPMALRAALLLVLISAAAAAEEPTLPRVIYGETLPQVLYGPPSAPPPEPHLAAPEPRPQPEAPPALEYGWVPAGPPIWIGRPPQRRPPPRRLPPRPPGDPWPQGFFRGVAPDARTPLDRR